MTRPARWMRGLTLRVRITLIATALFSVAVVVGAVVLASALRLALDSELNSSADKAAAEIAALVPARLPNILAVSVGIEEVQVVDADDSVIAASRGGDRVKSVLSPAELHRARQGHRLTVDGARIGSDERLRVTARPVGDRTVLVVATLGRVDDAVRILGVAALVGAPLAVTVMGLLTWSVVGLALRPVEALRYGADDITAAGLADRRRLPVPPVEDEIHRLAVTLNRMLDRIEAASARQRTFVGDAAHELRSPLASVRVQLEVAGRLGPETDWPSLVEEVLVDVDRLDRLVGDLLTLARLDESGPSLRRREPVDLAALAGEVVAVHGSDRVPVRIDAAQATVDGDPDALRRVLVNLVDNAVRYAASSVVVSVGPGLLMVADDGPGIPAADRERVFERFYRVAESRSRATGGTGLGLAIVRDVVRAHGGTVHLEDNGPGVRAVVRFPPLPVPVSAAAG